MPQLGRLNTLVWATFNTKINACANRLGVPKRRLVGAVLIGTASVGAYSARYIIPPYYDNYVAFTKLGSGALPKNVFGWAISGTMTALLSNETRTTKVYDEPWNDRYTKNMSAKDVEINRTQYLPELPQREGERPVIAPFIAPQREEKPVKDEKIMQVRCLFNSENCHPLNPHSCKKSFSPPSKMNTGIF